MKKINFKDLESKNPRVKYSCSKYIIALSKENPVRIYPHIKKIIALLDNENNIFKWTGILSLGYLSKVDKKNKIDKLLNKLIKFLDKGSMITANNTILSLSQIAKNKPKYSKKIINELTKVEKYNYATPECRKVALDKAIISFSEIKDLVRDNKKAINFIKRQTKTTRKSAKKRAEKLLKNLTK